MSYTGLVVEIEVEVCATRKKLHIYNVMIYFVHMQLFAKLR